MAKITLLLDEDVRPILGGILRQRGYDAVHVLDAGCTGQSDAEQLAYAVSQQRTILTHNIRHFRLLNQRYHEEGRSEEHTSELQSLRHLVCRLLLEKTN